MKPSRNIHATGLIYGEVGVVIRGPSGSGKSLLALMLLEYAEIKQIEGRLVGDDQLIICADGGQITMSAPATIAGKIELFGYGITARSFCETTHVHLVVDIVQRANRMPDRKDLSTRLFGINLARCPVAKREIIGLTHQRMIVVEAINGRKQ